MPRKKPTDTRHALDRADINAKIVVTEQGPVLATSEAALLFPKADIAYCLPIGARIRKESDTRFVSEQLDPAVSHPPRITTTATDAILGFVAYFHGAT